MPTGIIAGVAFVALFTNPQALNLIYTFHGGIPFPITGNLHYRNAEAYDYIAQRIKPGDEAGANTIRVNPMGRVSTLEELQNAATFLISGGCDWINGETIAMDGAQACDRGE